MKIQNKKVEAILELDKRLKSKKDGRHFISIYFYLGPGKQIWFRTGYKATQEEWETMNSKGRKSEELTERFANAREIQRQAQQILDSMETDQFSVALFKELLFGKKVVKEKNVPRFVDGAFPSESGNDNKEMGSSAQEQDERIIEKTGKETPAQRRERLRINRERMQRRYERDPMNVYKAFDLYIAELTEMGKIAGADIAQSARNSFYSFRPSLRFEDVTTRFLVSYEDYMLEMGRSPTTVSIRVRELRKMVNAAINEELIKEKDSPFSPRAKKRYHIPSVRNIKKALTAEEARKIVEYELPTPEGQFKKDLWVFSLFCNGIGVKDIHELCYGQIEGDYLFVRRGKTKGTDNNKRQIRIFLNNEAKRIIKKWGLPNVSPKSGVFFDLKGVDKERQYKDKGNLATSIQWYTKLAAKALGINKPVSSNVARHTFATLMKSMGMSIEQISEALGHSSIKTTQIYLADFPDQTKKESALQLTNLILTGKSEDDKDEIPA